MEGQACVLEGGRHAKVVEGAELVGGQAAHGGCAEVEGGEAGGARLHPQGGHGAGGDLEVLQEVQATEHAGGEEVQGAPLEGEVPQGGERGEGGWGQRADVRLAAEHPEAGGGVGDDGEVGALEARVDAGEAAGEVVGRVQGAVRGRQGLVGGQGGQGQHQHHRAARHPHH